MANPLPEDIKKRALKRCTGDLAYLQVQDPGTWIEANGKVLVMVLDQKKHGLWIEV
jgi:hypothetical protein